MVTERVLAAAFTLLIGASGAAVFWAIGFPAPFLTGPASAVSIAALLGVRLGIPIPLREFCFLTLGIGIGSTVTPEVLQMALTWPASLLVLSLSLYGTILLARRALTVGFGFDRVTALLAASPGHLSYVLGLSSDMKADVPRVALVQSVRVLLLTLIVPVILVAWGIEGSSPVVPARSLGLAPMVALFVLSVAVGIGFGRLSIPAPFLLAGMAVSASGHALDLTPGGLPIWMTLAAFVVMGSLIGTRFQGIAWADIRRSLWAGVGVTLIASALAAMAALLASGIIGLHPAVLLLAFAPGGVEVMAAMAVQLSLEPAFVAAHHVLRLVVLTALIPLFLWAERRVR